MATEQTATPGASSQAPPAPKGNPKAKAKGKSEKVKTEYDMSRATGPDPRDPRTAGPPCHGNHVPMAAGRGSLSGANAHGRWEVCKDCRLRLLYLPAYGAHAHYRQAGPLPADTKKAVEIMEERVAAGEPKAKETLNAKAVALQGAEDSLLRRLEAVRSQKGKAFGKSTVPNKKEDGYPKGTDGENPDKKTRAARPKSKPAPAQTLDSSDSDSSGMEAVNDPQRIPKKSAKRANAKDAEAQEAQAKEDGFLTAEGVLEETQAGMIRETMKEILASFDADVAGLPQHRSGIHLVEVGSSGASGLRGAVEDRHGNAARMSPYEFDFGRKSGLEQALEAARSLAPALMSMWVSVPCAALEEPEDTLAGLGEEQRRTQLHRRRRARKVLKTSLKLAEDQLARGGHVAWEWPADSAAWKEPEMKGFLRQLAKRGLMCPTEDKAAGKRWRIVTSSPELRKMVDHAQAETSEKKDPASMSRSLSVSSRYPPRLCRAVAEFALWADHWGGKAREAQAFGLSDEPLLESSLDPADRKRAEALVHRLHVRAGHPSGKTLAKVLKARGAHHEVIKIAMEHTCPDCQEMRLPDLAPSVSLQQSEVPWKVIQIDNAEVRVEDVVTHFMVITDEATHFAVVAKLFERNFQDGRNATAEEAILALEQHWTQAYGFPDRIRCDPEGCFRSKLLEAWASDLGIEVTPCPAEAHHQIGQVESLVKKLKQDAITLLAGHPVGAHRALLHSAAAHNTVHRVQGFSPAQWAFGRDFGPGGRLFESDQDLPVVQNSVLQGHTFHDHMEARRAAEDIARRSQATYQLGRMLNMKSRRKLQFVPGDLVYYRRVQPPADTPAHPGLGFAKVGLGRWFGPGRVLATETRSDNQSSVRKPAQTVWIVANGRLKRCSPDQLRHASEREAAIAEATDAATPPWTFSSLLQTLEGGGYDVFDDYVFPEDIGALPPVPRGRSRARSRTPGRETVHRNSDEGAEKQGRSAQNPTPRTPGGPPESSVDGRAGGEKRERSAQNPAPRTPGGSPTLPPVDPSRYLGDPSYDPTLFRFLMDQQAAERAAQQAAKQSAPLVKKAKAQVARPRQLSPVVPATPADKKQDGASSSQGPVGFVSEGEALLDPSDGLLCTIELPIPETENQWKRLRRDPTAWMAKGLRKQEVRYGRLEQKERDAFDIAKQAEVNQWIRESAARRVQGHVAQDRLMAMRWVLTYKDSGAAKARIVIVGYQDPDLATLVSSSPTMSRRTRQLVYQQSTLRHWKTMKADVRAAFLQTAPTQISRCVFARPVPELAKAMQLQDGEVVQIAKACYGLVNAPAEWYRDVNKTLVGLGMTLVGLIAAHVDDFVITGDESDAEWINIVGRSTKVTGGARGKLLITTTAA
ncbi:RE1 [Symbiodinium microadriaticum]|nr:RE1 [Symbiodinium microadriaticum]